MGIVFDDIKEKPLSSYLDHVTHLFLIFLCCYHRITVVVANIPSSDPSGRLIVLPKASAQDSKRAKKKSDYKVGSLVEAEVQLFSFHILKLSSFFIFQGLQNLLIHLLGLRLLTSSH